MALVPICPACKLPTSPAHDCVEAQARAMKEMLNNVGQQGLCRGCSAPGYWVTHYNGKATFYTPAGLNHFVNCPNGARFKR